MAIGVINQEWLAHNANRRYPLADDASGVDDSGSFSLPPTFLVSLDLPIHSGMNVAPANFFVRAVSAYAGGYGVVVGYQPADLSDPVNVATALIPRQGFTRNSVFALGGTGDFADTVGKLVVGKLDDIDGQPPGSWNFTLAAGRIDPDCVRPALRGVAGIVCVNGDQRSVPLYGDVELRGGSNMQIVAVLQEGQDPIIKFNAISGEGTTEECVCEGDSAPSAPITSVNGVGPTNAGDFTVIGSDCVEIENIPNGIRIKDVCSQPCCGCAELERVTEDLQRLQQQAATVSSFVDRVTNATDTMDSVVLGSRLRDAGCVQCPE